MRGKTGGPRMYSGGTWDGQQRYSGGTTPNWEYIIPSFLFFLYGLICFLHCSVLNKVHNILINKVHNILIEWKLVVFLSRGSATFTRHDVTWDWDNNHMLRSQLEWWWLQFLLYKWQRCSETKWRFIANKSVIEYYWYRFLCLLLDKRLNHHESVL